MKRNLTAFCLALILVLCLACAGSAEGGRNEALDAAFALGEPVRLMPAEVPVPEGLSPIGLSPDGKIVLGGDGIWFPEESRAVPVAFAPEKGCGDPYGKMKQLASMIMRQPSREGLSWSSDGRYAAFSDIETSLQRMKSPDVTVLDTATGEIWMADSYIEKAREDSFGLVLLSRISRSGEYLYYLTYERPDGEMHYLFRRCTPSGEEKEILFDMKAGEGSMLDFFGCSNLFETADGGWLLLGMDRYNRDKSREMALIRFPADGGARTPEVTSLHIPGSVFVPSFSSWSPDSGYGVVCLENATASYRGNAADDFSALVNAVPGHVNLLRILPGEGSPRDVWYLIRPDPDSGAVRMMPAEDFLWSAKILTGTVCESEKDEAEAWTAANEGERLPASYDAETFRRELQGSLLTITCACISPDGYYALINAGTPDDYRLYLISLETMDVLPVEAPECIGSVNLSRAGIGSQYRPGITWNEDGTLIIQYGGTGQGKTGLFRLGE